MNLNRQRGVEGDLYKYIERCDTTCGELQSIQNLLKEQRERPWHFEMGYGSAGLSSSWLTNIL